MASIQLRENHRQQGAVAEEIDGLIRVYKDGRVDRLPIIPNVPCNIPSELKVTARDIVMDKFINLWVRIYVPQGQAKLPLLVYFHGGGFCVGSAAWSCYHDFAAKLASKAGCVIMAVNYRLAPENRLPAAYEDGLSTIKWAKQQATQGSSEHSWWLTRSDLSRFFLAGDSAGANIAHNVALQLGSMNAKPLCHKGTILIQPFFGGETRTPSERAPQPRSSALTSSASDTYWRLSLPGGSNKEHVWCNPVVNGAANLKSVALPTTMVCVAEMDILFDRSKEFCSTMANAGKQVQIVIYKGVGHAFQILDNSMLAQARTQEMMIHLKAFINR